jgi:hypothetical protein
MGKINDLLNGSESTLLLVTPDMLREFAQTLIAEASAQLRSEEEPTYTPAEFAARHRIDKSTLWRWCREGRLKKTVIGKKVFYKDSDLSKEDKK